MRSRIDALQIVLVICCFIFALFMVGCGSDTRIPTTPNDVRIINPTETTLSVIWNSSIDNVSVAGYEVIRNGFPYLLTEYMGFTDSGLQLSTIYCYQIRAFDLAGNVSMFSPHACESTLPVIVNSPIINSPSP